VFLRERKPEGLDELARLAEQYLEAHANSKTAVKKPEKEGFSSLSAFPHKRPETQSFRRPSSSKKTCFTCGKLGHISKDCFHNKKKLAGMEQRYSSRGGYSKPSFGRGYNSQASHPMPGSSSHETETTSQTSQNQKIRCKKHQREMCGECFHIPSQCNAALHLCGTEVMFDCGCRIPVIADACKSGLERMPDRTGWIGDRNVSVLRDTGCSTVVIKRSLVDNNQLTGAEETCVLIDDTVRKTPVAEVEVNTPYYQGKVRTVCMRDPLYDVIIGNISGVKSEDSGSCSNE